MTIRTLTRRVQLVCDPTDSLTDETKCLDNVLSKNNYIPDFVKRNVYKNSEPTKTKAKPVTTATIPYIKGTSETVAWNLQPYNIQVTSQTDYDFTTTFNKINISMLKTRTNPNERQGAVYKIKCCNCQALHR